MSIKFKLTCESCRRHVEHKATAEQYQKLLQKLRCTFPCPCCATLIQVEMMAEGLSYSTIMPTSGVAREVSDSSGSHRGADAANHKTEFQLLESEKTPFSVSAETSLDGPVSHVPFLPIGSDAPRKFKGSVSQRFFQWYNTQSMLIQCGVLSPLLLLLVLLLLWDPNRDSGTLPKEDSAVEAPPKSTQKLEVQSKTDNRAVIEPTERFPPSDTPGVSDAASGTAIDAASDTAPSKNSP